MMRDEAQVFPGSCHANRYRPELNSHIVKGFSETFLIRDVDSPIQQMRMLKLRPGNIFVKSTYEAACSKKSMISDQPVMLW